jgi:hypothetical protein
VWLVIYEGLPLKARLAKSRLFGGLYPIFHHFETMKHMFWDCQFVKSSWKYGQGYCSFFLHGRVHWWETLLGDYCNLVHCSFPVFGTI